MKQEILCSLLGAAMVLPTAALAQEAAKQSRNTAADLEEVVITGSLIKREESSLLVTTLSSDEITERARSVISSLLRVVTSSELSSRLISDPVMTTSSRSAAVFRDCFAASWASAAVGRTIAAPSSEQRISCFIGSLPACGFWAGIPTEC